MKKIAGGIIFLEKYVGKKGGGGMGKIVAVVNQKGGVGVCRAKFA